MGHPFVLCDVFSDRPLAGNQLAVFPAGAAVPERLMQPLAAEIGFSETAFLGRGGLAGTPLRIFTPSRELDFAGHPTIGAAVVAAGSGAEIVMLPAAGPVRVVLETQGPRRWTATMDQPLPSVAPWPEPDILLRVLGCGRPVSPVEVYDNGMRHVMVHLDSPAAVAELHPDPAVLAAAAGEAGVSCFAPSGGHWVTRMFAPGSGVYEDPATGSAAGPLAVHLGRHGSLPFGTAVRLHQGEAVGRPSVLVAVADADDSGLRSVRVTGGVVVVGRGEFDL